MTAHKRQQIECLVTKTMPRIIDMNIGAHVAVVIFWGSLVYLEGRSSS
jgi:hypothetical protein